VALVCSRDAINVARVSLCDAVYIALGSSHYAVDVAQMRSCIVVYVALTI